jgi:hypothetical protein
MLPGVRVDNGPSAVLLALLVMALVLLATFEIAANLLPPTPPTRRLVICPPMSLTLPLDLRRDH